MTGATGFVGQRLLGALAQEFDDDSSHVRLRFLTRILHPDYESVVCDLQSEKVPDDALNGTTALHMLCLNNGANILRVHDVKAAKEAIKIWGYYVSV